MLFNSRCRQEATAIADTADSMRSFDSTSVSSGQSSHLQRAALFRLKLGLPICTGEHKFVREISTRVGRRIMAPKELPGDHHERQVRHQQVEE